ncbi:MAG: hypothetical protein OEY19_14175 [Gammaproteobacteria bacterium]|nr:hypothetical protein [Gammaproteobacteria bacterium]MDH5630808.1 hypothetical protein [Gammaproteobacteria bacterium]
MKSHKEYITTVKCGNLVVDIMQNNGEQKVTVQSAIKKILASTKYSANDKELFDLKEQNRK